MILPGENAFGDRVPILDDGYIDLAGGLLCVTDFLQRVGLLSPFFASDVFLDFVPRGAISHTAVVRK